MRLRAHILCWPGNYVTLHPPPANTDHGEIFCKLSIARVWGSSKNIYSSSSDSAWIFTYAHKLYILHPATQPEYSPVLIICSNQSGPSCKISGVIYTSLPQLFHPGDRALNISLISPPRHTQLDTLPGTLNISLATLLRKHPPGTSLLMRVFPKLSYFHDD